MRSRCSTIGAAMLPVKRSQAGLAIQSPSRADWQAVALGIGDRAGLDQPLGARTRRARLCHPSSQPLFEGPETDLGIIALQPFDVGFEAGIIEPPEHLVELPPQHNADYGEREPLKFHLSPEHAAENLRCFNI